MTARCPGGSRHWYSFHGQAGFRSPVCVRLHCGHPNPRPLTDNDWDILLAYRELRGRPYSAAIEAAISAELARRAALGGTAGQP
jgi:hypothetical protein